MLYPPLAVHWQLHSVATWIASEHLFTYGYKAYRVDCGKASTSPLDPLSPSLCQSFQIQLESGNVLRKTNMTRYIKSLVEKSMYITRWHNTYITHALHMSLTMPRPSSICPKHATRQNKQRYTSPYHANIMPMTGFYDPKLIHNNYLDKSWTPSLKPSDQRN